MRPTKPITPVSATKHAVATAAMVNTSVAEKNKAIEEAKGQENEILTATAGEAWREILRQIDQYEADLALNDKAKASTTLAVIDGLLAGETVKIDGKDASFRVYGQVTQLVNEAQSEKTRLINQLRGETASFGAKRDLFAQNRRVFLNTEWSDAFGAFMGNKSVQQLMMPPMGRDGRMVLTLGRDPEVNNRIVREANRAAAAKAEQERQRRADRERYERKIDAMETKSQ